MVFYFNSLVKGGSGKSVRILGVQSDSHNIMSVALKSSHLFPAFIPVPGFN